MTSDSPPKWAIAVPNSKYGSGNANRATRTRWYPCPKTSNRRGPTSCPTCYGNKLSETEVSPSGSLCELLNRNECCLLKTFEFCVTVSVNYIIQDLLYSYCRDKAGGNVFYGNWQQTLFRHPAECGPNQRSIHHVRAAQ